MRCDKCNKEMKLITGRPYHYIESGPDNVYLKGIPVYKCTCGDTVAEIPNVKELHTVIAGHLLKKPGQLTGKEIRFIRKQMRLKAIELAEQLGISKITLSRWENGTEPIGPANDKLLRLVFLLHYIKGLIEKGVVSQKLMHKYVEFANQIATMRQLSQRRKKIQISEEDLQRVPETELLLTEIS